MNNNSQLRKHIRFSFKNKLRSFLQSNRLGELGDKVFIDLDVSLLRFHKNIFIKKEVVL